jgi:diguanylate cyclase (GGDEF)-like protein
LTGLPNRLLFHDRLEQALLRARRFHHRVGVLVLDLDRVKEVNDSLGHAAGDELIAAVAGRLRQAVRQSDTAARIGGDEFAVALPELHAADDARIVVRRILAAVAAPLDVGGRELRPGTSIGVAIFPDHGDGATELLRDADVAMYQAKQAGRHTHRVFSPAAGGPAPDVRMVEERLRRAIDERQLLLHYQPQVDLATRTFAGAEALVRWLDPERGMVPPMDFLPLAEELGLIVPIGEWVLRTACLQNATWRAAGMPCVPIAVNLSGRQLLHPGLEAAVFSALERAGLKPGDLELEVTERGLGRDPQQALATLRRLHERGVRIAVDDLGTGDTSLAFLTRVPAKTLKIAQTLVRELPGREQDRAVAEAIIALARELGVDRVVAEGVETSEQLEFLRRAGCDAVQGYAIGRPMSAQELATLVADPTVIERRARKRSASVPGRGSDAGDPAGGAGT